MLFAKLNVSKSDISIASFKRNRVKVENIQATVDAELWAAKAKNGSGTSSYKSDEQKIVLFSFYKHLWFLASTNCLMSASKLIQVKQYKILLK